MAKKSPLGGKVQRYASLQEITMQQYVNVLKKDARPAQNAAQRIYDMIMEQGVDSYNRFGAEVKSYPFFQDLDQHGKPSENSLYGIDEPLQDIVEHFEAAARKFGPEKRVLLLHGPVGSAKSTIATLLKRGLEKYSLTHPLYTFRWTGLGDYTSSGFPIEASGMGKVTLYDHTCQLHEEPLKLIDITNRKDVVQMINEANQENEKMKYELEIAGDLCPHCRFNYDMLMMHYDGEWDQVMEHIKVFQFYISESDRRGIGTFQPKDEKNQDATELTGNIDYRKIALFGSDSDPRAFNFDGELCVANRGMVEFIEILKLERAFLYDLLGASQEQKIKPKKFPLTDVDLVIISHTNEEEFKRLQDDELMRAFKDRTSRHDVPYNLILDREEDIYAKIFTRKKVGKHIAPHALRMASIFATLTRLEAPKEASDDGLSRVEKMHLYNGRKLPDKDEAYVRKLLSEVEREGLDGISTRFIIDAIAKSIVGHDEPCLNPFQVHYQIEQSLKRSANISSKETVQEFLKLAELAKGEYEKIVKDEINKAVVNNPEELRELFQNYIDNVQAFADGSKLEDPFHPGRMIDPNERLMREIEEKINVAEGVKENFRESIIRGIARTAVNKEEPFQYDSNERLYEALKLKLFEEKKDKMNFGALLKGTRSEEDEASLNIIKTNLINDMSYCNHCSENILEFAASIFARGDE